MARGGGRYWNLGLSDRSSLGATDKQLRYLQSIYGRDFRGEGLTQGKASDLIDEGMEMRAKQRNGLSDIADQLFTHLMKRAIEAANNAGEQWLLRHPEPHFLVVDSNEYIGVHGVVGHAYITAPKKGSGLAKWMREHGFDDRRNSKSLSLQHRYTERLEADLHLACCAAALKVLKEAANETGDLRIIFLCDRANYKNAA